MTTRVTKHASPLLLKRGVRGEAGQPMEIVLHLPTAPALTVSGFEFDSAFPGAALLGAVPELVQAANAAPEARLMVFGHADEAGSDAYNKRLADRRAKAVLALLTHDLALLDEVAKSDEWRLIHYQAIMLALGIVPMKVDDQNGPKTKRGLERFQRAYNADEYHRAGHERAHDKLKVDGVIGPRTEAALRDAYLAQVPVSLPKERFFGPKFAGCSEFNRVGDPKKDRRVVLALYRPDFPTESKIPCKEGDAGACKLLKKTKHPLRCNFYRRTLEAERWVEGAALPIGIGALTSRLALDELAGLAEDMGEYGFVSWMNRVFGDDVPMAAYRQLFADLGTGAVIDAPIALVAGGPDGHPAAYDRNRKVVVVDAALVAEAIYDEERAFVLACALVEEFGHHVDHLLRNTYSDRGHDAPLDEGARFGYALLSPFCKSEGPRVKVGSYAVGSATHDIFVDLSDFGKEIDEVLGNWEQRRDERNNHYEYFGAGTGKNRAGAGHSFGHQSIENALADVVPEFDDEQRRLEVYFGNWLRDYSQAIVPTLLRDPGAPPDAPGLSRETLTRVVDVLARKEFGDTAQFRVDQAKLGVYRTEEHIDNPYGLADGRHKDPTLDAAPIPRQLEVNPRTWLKQHIDTDCSTPGVRRPSAVDFAEGSLRRAIASGFNATGRMHLGAALHTLEDYFSHSNFIELALIQLGHDRVFPWTAPVALSPQRPIFPVVTGCFGSVDTAASIAYEISETMTRANECKPGERAPGAAIALILIGDKKPEWKARAEAALSQYEHFQKTNPTVFRAYCKATDWLFGWVDHAIGEALHLGASLMDDAQTEYVQNLATSTNPTHSQLAKDHDDHPLHVLAAQCAQDAVRAVARDVVASWNGKMSPDGVAATLRKFFVHPAHMSMLDLDAGLIIDRIKGWAADAANRDRLERTYSTTIREHISSSHEWSEARETARTLIQHGRQARETLESETTGEAIDRRQRELQELWRSLSPSAPKP